MVNVYLFLPSHVPHSVLVSGCGVVPAFMSAVSGECRVREGGHVSSVFIPVFTDSNMVLDMLTYKRHIYI